MKKNKDPKKEKLENYLQEVKEKEKRKRKQRMLVLLFTLFISIGGFGYYKLMLSGHSSEEFRYVKADGLSIYKVDSMFKVSQQALIVTNDLEGRMDTVHSVNEYLDLAIDIAPDVVPEVEKTSLDSSVVIEDEESVPSTNSEVFSEAPSKPKPAASKVENTLEDYFFDLAGRRIEGEKLKFTIEDYDSDIVYIMDFGNGKRQRVGREWEFSFDKAGTYQLALIAANSAGAKSQYIKKIIIDKAEDKEIEANSTAQPTASSNLAEDRVTKPIASNILSEEPTATNSTEKAQLEAAEAPIKDEEPVAKPSEVDTKTPLKFAEKMPSFPGGTAAMYKFLNKKLKYPELARENEIEGKVYVQFIVESNGAIKDLQIIKGLGYGCDEEAMRVIKLMPKWEAGIHKGVKVPVYYTLAVNFRFR